MSLRPKSSSSACAARPRHARSWRPKSIAALLLLVGVLMSGCVSRLQQARRFGSVDVRDFVILAPTDALRWPCVRQFAEWKERSGFSVHGVAVDRAEGTPLRQAQDVARRLEAVPRRGAGPAYLLVIASAETITMGPWRLSNDGQAVYSDLPLTFASQLRTTQIEDAHWLPETRSPKWHIGRLPFDDEQAVATALRAAQQLQGRSLRASKRAQIGAEQIVLPCDASVTLSTVRADLRMAGWEARMLSDDWLGDGRIDDLEVEVPVAGDECSVQVQYRFLSEWANDAPDLVYLVTHGVGWEGMVGSGRYAMCPLSFVAYTHGGHVQVDAPAAPASPGMLVTSACTFGLPDNAMLHKLFTGGWIAGCCCCTTVNWPLPPASGFAAERDLAYYLARGLPVGLAVAATRDAYLRGAARDPISWLFGKWTGPSMRANAFCYTVYGDPSLELVRDRCHPHGPAR